MEKLAIILNESVSCDEIDGVAYDNGWVVSRIIKETEDTPEEVIFQTKDDQNFIHYIIEQDGGYPYLTVEGNSIESTVNTICLSLPTHSREEIIRMIRSPSDYAEYCKGILYLGLSGRFQKSDGEVLELFRQILQHENSEIRIGGLFGMSYSGWPEFRALAQPLIENDSDSNVRETAARFVEGFDLYATTYTS